MAYLVGCKRRLWFPIKNEKEESKYRGPSGYLLEVCDEIHPTWALTSHHPAWKLDFITNPRNGESFSKRSITYVIGQRVFTPHFEVLCSSQKIYYIVDWTPTALQNLTRALSNITISSLLVRNASTFYWTNQLHVHVYRHSDDTFTTCIEIYSFYS